MIEELGVVGEHAPAGGAGHHLLLGVAAEVLTELRAAFEGAGTAFPATQHHVVVLAKRLVVTAQGVRLHMPIEPLRIVEGTLCQEQLGVRLRVGGGTLTSTCPKGASQLSPKLTWWG